MKVKVPFRRLAEYSANILSAAGLPEEDALLVASSLVDANLRGVDSHGVSRIPIYVRRLQLGLVNTRPDVRVVKEAGGALVVDGDNGMGQVVLQRSLGLALDRLTSARTVSVAVRNSNHYGSGAYFAKRAVAANAAMFLYGNAPATMSAWGGRERFLGPNPYTFGVPAGTAEPMILDMATSVVARGKIIQAGQLGEEIPEGWAVDVHGEPTTDPEAALAGSVLPFGGPKGYGIALMVEVMAAMFSGAGSGPEIGDLYDDLDRPQGAGAFFTLHDVGAFQPLEEFGRRMEGLFAAIKESGAANREVLIPGELEARAARRNEEQGIAVPLAVVAELEKLLPGSRLLVSETPQPDNSGDPRLTAATADAATRK